MHPAVRADLVTMGRIALWLAYLLLMTPIAAVAVHAMARVIWGVNLE